MNEHESGRQNGGPPEDRRRRWPRRLAVALVVLVALPLVLIALAVAVLYTEAGSQWALERGLQAFRDRGTVDVRAQETEGSLLGGFVLRGVSVADSEGIWFTADRLALEWQPSRLFEGRVWIEALEAADVDVLRHPITPEDTAEDTGGGNPLALLSRVTVRTLDLDRIRLAEPVLGEEMVFRAQGDVEGEDVAGVQAAFTAERLDQPGRAEAELVFAPDGALVVNTVVYEPEGGLLARLLDLPGLPAVRITLNGEGPAEAWKGSMLAEAEGVATVEADLALSIGDSTSARAEGIVRPGPNAPEILRVLSAMQPVEFLVDGGRGEGGQRLDTLSVTASGWSLQAEGRLASDGGLDATAVLDVQDGAPFAQLTAVPVGAARIEADIGGTMAAPTIAADLAVRETLVETVNARVEATLEEAVATFAVSGRLEGIADIAPELGPLAGEGVDVAFEGAFDRENQRVSVDTLTIEARAFQAEGEGAITLEPFLVSGDLRAISEELSVFAPFVGLPLAGQGTLTANVEQAGREGTSGTIGISLADFALGIPAADALLAGSVNATTKAKFGDDGLRLDDLSVRAPGLALDGSVFLRDMDVLDGTFVLSLPDLARLPYDLQGAAVAEGQISGVLASPVLTAAVRGENFVAANLPVQQPRATLRLSPEQIGINEVSAAIGGATVTGALSLPFDTGLLVGEVRAAVAPAKALALPGLALQGRAEAVATFGGAGEVQTLDVKLEGTDVVLPDLGVATAVLDGEAFLRDPFGNREGTAAIGLSNGRVAEVPFAGLRVAATLGGEAMQVDLDAEGSEEIAYEASASATLELAEAETLVRLDTLSVTGQGHTVALTAPARVVLGDGVTRIEEAQLAIDSGRMTANAILGGGRIEADIEGRGVPLQVFELVRPEYPLNGTLAFNVEVAGPLTGQGPTGTITLSTSAVSVPEAEISGLRLAANGRIAEGRLALTASFTGITDQPASVTADLPLAFSPAGVPSVPQDVPITAAVNWAGPLQAVWALVPQVSHRVAGQGVIDARVSGTLDKPILAGQAAVSDGTYENLEWGTVVRRIEAQADLMETGNVRLSGRATDGGRGRIALEGLLDNSGAGASNLTADVTLENATLIRSEDLEATIGGQLAYRGSLDTGKITGDLHVRGAEFVLGDGLSGGVATLNVVELDEAGEEVAQTEATSVGSAVELEVGIDIPNQVFVRGEGLDSEWGGTMRITGSLADPRLVGDLRVVRGSYAVLGQTFRFERGTIDFQGGDEINPALNIRAVTDAEDITTIVAVTGTADDPKIALESRPPLPQDEILARTLFGTSVGELSPGQALGIAQAVAKLTGVGGGGLGILGAVRSSFGLDVLSIGAGAGGGAKVEAGKYLSEDVYVGVEQDTKAGSSSVNIEVELTPRVSVETKAGGDDTNVGIEWKFDY